MKNAPKVSQNANCKIKNQLILKIGLDPPSSFPSTLTSLDNRNNVEFVFITG